MRRRFTTFLMVCSVLFLLSRCNDDEASSPPRSSFTVDRTQGKAFADEFTFVVDQVDAQEISLLPYGAAKPSLGGIRIPKSSFKDGKATVKFTYAEVGDFDAVVVTNNHTADGESVKTSLSDVKKVSINSDRNEISEFTFEKSTKTDIVKTDPKSITVTVPYGTDVKTLKAKFVASPFSTVSVGSAVQSSDATVNDFTNPVAYTVESNDGTLASYTVKVIVTPIENNTSLKSFSGRIASKSDKDKPLSGSIDEANGVIVLYGAYGTPNDRYDSVRVKWELNGKFSYLKFGGKKIKQDSLLNFSTPKQVEVVSQDSTAGNGRKTYTVYAVNAPKIELKFSDLKPVVSGQTDGFAITLKVLKGTDIDEIITDVTETLPAGVTISGMKADGVGFISGDDIDYSQNVKLELTVNDANIAKTYVVVYTISVLQLN